MLQNRTGLLPRCIACACHDDGLCGAAFAKDDGAANLGQQFFTVGAGGLILDAKRADGAILVVCSGWAFRFLDLSDGRRAIVKFLLPGDVVSVRPLLPLAGGRRLDLAVEALTDVQLCAYPVRTIRERCVGDQQLMSVMLHVSNQDMHDAYQLAGVLGQRSAHGRIAFLLLRLMTRAVADGPVENRKYPFPLRHQHLADIAGMTTVHVSRVLAQLRDRGMLTVSEGGIAFHDLAAVREAAGLA